MQHGSPYITAKYSEIMLPNNSFKKCSFAPKNIPGFSVNLIALQAVVNLFSKGVDISKR